MLKQKAFYAKLPKGLVWCTVTGSESFKFYYLHKQVIAFNIDIDDDTPIYDTSYIPSQSETAQFIDTNYPGKDKHDLSKIDYMKERKHLMIKKGTATILLYNVAPKNYRKFTGYLTEFKFLDDPAG